MDKCKNICCKKELVDKFEKHRGTCVSVYKRGWFPYGFPPSVGGFLKEKKFFKRGM